MKASWEMTSLEKLHSSLAEAKNSLDDVNTKLKKITGREENYRLNSDSKMDNPLPRRISSTDGAVGGWHTYKRSQDERYNSNSKMENPLPRKIPSTDDGVGGWHSNKRPREDKIKREDESKEKRMKQYTPMKVSRMNRLQDSEILKISEKPNKPIKEDKVTIERNRRMFGNIMSTLKQFQMTEVRNSTSNKEQRRREIAHKLEREEQEDREQAANQKRDLLQSKNDMQQQVACIEEKIEIEKMNTVWDAHYDTLSHFIRTKAFPRIFYLPKKHSKTTQRLLAETKKQLSAHKTARRRKIDDAITSKYSTNVSQQTQHKSKSNNSKHSR